MGIFHAPAFVHDKMNYSRGLPSESGVDAFTIMRIAGHSSITVSQRYVHPSPESVERAFQGWSVSLAIQATFLDRND
jgi:hypothetical protein